MPCIRLRVKDKYLIQNLGCAIRFQSVHIYADHHYAAIFQHDHVARPWSHRRHWRWCPYVCLRVQDVCNTLYQLLRSLDRSETNKQRPPVGQLDH